MPNAYMISHLVLCCSLTTQSPALSTCFSMLLTSSEGTVLDLHSRWGASTLLNFNYSSGWMRFNQSSAWQALWHPILPFQHHPSAAMTCNNMSSCYDMQHVKSLLQWHSGSIDWIGLIHRLSWLLMAMETVICLTMKSMKDDPLEDPWNAFTCAPWTCSSNVGAEEQFANTDQYQNMAPLLHICDASKCLAPVINEALCKQDNPLLSPLNYIDGMRGSCPSGLLQAVGLLQAFGSIIQRQRTGFARCSLHESGSYSHKNNGSNMRPPSRWGDCNALMWP
jgi:hypothetical protein